MATKRTIHVVGTGTIGEPLLGLLLHTQRALEVDEITFHKHSPRLGDRAKITNLMRRGARLAVDAEKRTDFEKLGLQPTYTTEEALAQATVSDRLYLGWAGTRPQTRLVRAFAQGAGLYCPGQRDRLWQDVRPRYQR